ncbi:C-GCAxxG-C-C family (seleno)protein [Desulfococcus sp.]|uniref:C-GCAxxG-C-C family (seleno)protein n=1 Tax=Desulfococcus sp. TaxID=2025834 RepID=UPI00359384FD
MNILNLNKKLGAGEEVLIGRLRERAGNLYLTRQLLCAEAVMVSLNHGLDGGLSESQAVAVAAPFCAAMGESGCLCGALSGAELACGLFLGKERPYRHRREIRDSAKALHDAFKAAHGATCCRVLTRSVRHEKEAHFRHCAGLTADAAELAARMILARRPELAARVGEAFLSRKDSRIGGVLRRLLHRFSN